MASIDLRVTGREILFFGLLGTLLGLSGCGSLIFDTRFRSVAAVKSDLNSGADANQTTGFGLTPLYWAVHKGRVNVVKLLLAHGANVNQATRIGTTPLMEAAMRNRVTIAKILLLHGASPNKTDKNGITPLWFASHSDYPDMVKLLLAHGAVPGQEELDGAEGKSKALIQAAMRQPRKKG